MMTNHLNDPGHAARKIADFLKILSTTGGLNLKSHILACNGQVQPNSSDTAGAVSAVSPETPLLPIPIPNHSRTQRARYPAPSRPQRRTSLRHRAHRRQDSPPRTRGSRSHLLRRRRLQGNSQPRTGADGRDGHREGSRYRRAFLFLADDLARAPHPSLALAKSGLPTASSGEGPGRFVVLYPEGLQPVHRSPLGSRPHPRYPQQLPPPLTCVVATTTVPTVAARRLCPTASPRHLSGAHGQVLLPVFQIFPPLVGLGHPFDHGIPLYQKGLAAASAPESRPTGPHGAEKRISSRMRVPSSIGAKWWSCSKCRKVPETITSRK